MHWKTYASASWKLFIHIFDFSHVGGPIFHTRQSRKRLFSSVSLEFHPLQSYLCLHRIKSHKKAQPDIKESQCSHNAKPPANPIPTDRLNPINTRPYCVVAPRPLSTAQCRWMQKGSPIAVSLRRVRIPVHPSRRHMSSLWGSALSLRDIVWSSVGGGQGSLLRCVTRTSWCSISFTKDRPMKHSLGKEQV